MKSFLKATVVLAVVCAFTSCSKESDRAVEAPPKPPVDGKADTAEVTTKKEGGCKTVTITTENVDGKTVRYESINENSGLQARTTSDKGINSIIDTTGKASSLYSSVAADGTKTKIREMRYSFVKNTKRFFEKKPANVFFQKDDYVSKQTADEGFFFKGAGDEKLKTREVKAVTEIEYFDDGVMTKTLSYKLNGKVMPEPSYEYSTAEYKDGEYEGYVETLKAPYTEEGTTTESEVTTCKFKKIN